MFKKVLIVLIALLILILGYFLYYRYTTQSVALTEIGCFKLEQKHIDSLRNSKVTLNTVEGVAPMLAMNLSDIIFPGKLFSNDSLKSRNKNVIKGVAFAIFVQTAELKAAEYSFANLLFNDKAHMRNIANTDLVKLYKQPQTSFNFTEQHAKLLKATDAGYKNYVIGINPKRPYGDATAFELDMADILGISLDKKNENYEQQAKELFTLHDQLVPALQVLLINGKIKTGTYCKDKLDAKWQKQDP